MKTASVKFFSQPGSRAFTLVELMIAMSIGILLAGTVSYLLVQASMEEQRGYSDTTIEESAYKLQANIVNCLRCMSSGYGFTPLSTSQVGTNTQWFSSIYVFQPNTNGSSYTTAEISANTINGSVTYTPNITAPLTQVVWFTNSPSVVLRKLYFFKSNNLDGSANTALVNVGIQMDDNGYSLQNATNNIANIYRFFSVQMRCD
jgi:prepilin-type N-terminal cleavage/methylation domain-containing protein